MEETTYEEFINNILDTRGRFNCGDEYHERHHIVPKCMGGGNTKDNLIDLFAREHFEAHRLLALENPDVQGLTYAWWCMSVLTNKDTMERYHVTAEEYEEARKAYANIQSEREVSEDTRQKIRNTMKGRTYSIERKINISNSLKGNPNVGVKGRTTIHKDSQVKRVENGQLQDYLNEGWEIGRPPMSQETKDKISKGNKGKDNFFKGKKRGPQSPEHIEKMASHKRGQIHINNGKVSKMINKEDFEEYEKQGFVRGRLKWK